MSIDYDLALEVAKDFCGVDGDRRVSHYDDGTLYATDNRIAIAIHDVGGAMMDQSKSALCGRIRDLFKEANDEREAGRRHLVKMPALEEALRTVLAAVAKVGDVRSIGGFGLRQGCVLLDEGYIVAAHYAQLVFALYDEFDYDGEVCGWVLGAGKPVLFRGKRWEVMIMPLRRPVGPLAEVQQGVQVPSNEIEEGE